MSFGGSVTRDSEAAISHLLKPWAVVRTSQCVLLYFSLPLQLIAQ